MLAIHTNARRPLRSAFSLIELLVVLTIIAVLIGLLLTAVQKVRAASDRTLCQNNLRQLALAALHHHEVKSQFPTGVHVGLVAGRGSSWETELLPYVEQEGLQLQLKADLENFVEGSNAAMARVIPLLVCPSDPLPSSAQWCNRCGLSFAVGSYGGNAGTRLPDARDDARGWDGIFYQDSHTRIADVTDGTSNTLLLGERSHGDKEFDVPAWHYARNYSTLRGLGKWANYCYPMHHLLTTAVSTNYQTPPYPSTMEADVWGRISAFGSDHPGGANVAFADGSVRFLSDQMKLVALQALSTRAGTEVVDAPW